MPWLRRLLLAVLLAGEVGCASLQLPTMGGLTGPPPPVGTPAWWKKHKKKAEIVPGHGYRVAGVDGYFDGQGRPINSRAAKVIEEKTSGGILGDMKVNKTVRNLKEQVGLGPDQREAELAYRAGEEAFRREDYDEAAKYFKAAGASWPDSQLSQDAMFYQGESYFFANRYSKATTTFEKLIRDNPNTPHLDKVIARQFAIARYWDQYHQYNPNWATHPNLFDKTRPLFDTVGRAVKNYDNIRLNDPTGPLADDAVMASANSYFLRGRYRDADEQYELLRKDYPRSRHQFDAHILSLQCKLRNYQGPAYDDAPLTEARQLIKQLKQQFAGELNGTQKKRLAEIDGQLGLELAQRDFNMAKHYEGLAEYEAARFYHAEVLRKHGATPLAEESRTQLAALEGLPGRPTSRLEPLLKLVPQNAERAAVAQVPLVQPGADLLTPPGDAPQLARQPESADQDGTTRR